MKIYKYDIHLLHRIRHIKMPIGAKIVKVGCQESGVVAFWAIVDTDKDYEMRNFVVVATGHDFNSNVKYVGSMLDNGEVWHLLEFKGNVS